MHSCVDSFKFIKMSVFLMIIAFSQVSCLAVNNLSIFKKNTPPANTQTSTSYSESADISKFGTDSVKLKGQYAGIYHCGNTTTQFVLNFKDTAGSRVSGNILRTNITFDFRGNRQKSMTTDTSLTGRYDAKSATLQFRLGRTDTRFIHKHNHRTAWLYGVMLPDASGFVMFDNAPISSQCSLWVAKRGDRLPSEWTFLENEANPAKKAGFFDRFSISREQKSDRGRNQCDPKLAAWLKNADKAPKTRSSRHQHHVRMMYSDKYFTPYFGKPFHAIDASDRQIFAIRLSGSCQRDRTLMQTGTGLASQIAHSFSRRSKVTDVDKGISEIGFNMLFAWLDQAKQYFAHMAKQQAEPTQVKTVLKSADSVLKQLYPVDKIAFTTYAIDQYKKMIMPSLRKDLQSELAANPSSLSELNELASFDQRSIKRYPEVDKTKLAKLMVQVKQKVNQNALVATQTFSQEYSGMQGIMKIDTWQERFKNVSVLLDSHNSNKVSQIFSLRRQIIAAQILKSEKSRYQQQVTKLGANPGALKSGVAYETYFVKMYSSILTLVNYVSFKHMRQKTREKLLARTLTSMSTLINKQKHARSLKALEREYLMDGDRYFTAGKNIHTVLAKRYQVVAPFQTGSNFKHYLNALYTYDTQTLTELDWVSARPVAKAMDELIKPMLGLGAILEDVSGGLIPGRKIMRSSFAGAEEASLIYPVMAFYILNYQRYNQACIESDAYKRTVQYRWEEHKTVGGVRFLSDSGGHDTTYLINRRFNPIFEVIYKDDGDGAIAKFSDRFFQGKGKIYRDELIAGTYTIMQMNCNSGLIKKMESNMIRYFSRAKARLDNAKRKAYSR